MWKDFQVARIVPDTAGRGGSKKSLNEWQTGPLIDTWEVQNVHTWQGAWRREAQSVDWTETDASIQVDPHAQHMLALHPFVRYSPDAISGAGTVEVLSHDLTQYAEAGTYGNGHVFNHSTGQMLLTGLGQGVAAARFATIADRCLIATGDKEAYWYSGADRNPNTYALGVDPPRTAPVCSVPVSTLETPKWYGTAGQTQIQIPDGGLLSTIPNAQVVSLRTTAGATQSVYIGATLPIVSDTDLGIRFALRGAVWCAVNRALTGANIANVVGLRIATAGKEVDAVVLGAYVPVLTPPATATDVDGWNNAFAVPATNTDVDTTILWLSAPVANGVGVWNRGADEPGEVGDAPPSVVAFFTALDGGLATPCSLTGISRYTDTIVPGVHVALTATNPILVDDGHGTLITNLADVVIFGASTAGTGAFTWVEGYGPSWAYALFDPVTGHVSNISPVTTMPGAQTDVSVAIELATLDWPVVGSEVAGRFTYFLFFRNYVSAYGSSLYVVGSLSPSDGTHFHGISSNLVAAQAQVPGGTYWIDNYPDSELLLDTDFLAPRFTNGKPKYQDQAGNLQPLSATDVAFWDGRLWLVGRQDGTALKFSCDRAQCPFGRPEESFPLRNEIRIPAEDGRIVGLKLWSERLLITTERWAYTISGSSELDYRLLRISARMAGVGPYQMDEIPSEMEGSGGGLAFIHPDGRVYVTTPGSDPHWISQDIQNILTSWASARTTGGPTIEVTARDAYQYLRVHFAQVEGRRILAVSNGTDQALLYDIDQKVWTQFKEEPVHCFTTLYGTIFGRIELIGSLGVDGTRFTYPRTWLGYTSAGGISDPTATFMATTEMDFDSQKSRKQIGFIRLLGNHVNGVGETGIWKIGIAVDGDTTSYGDVEAEAYTVDEVPYMAYRPVPGQREWIVTGASFSKPIMGYRFRLTIKWPQSTFATTLYAIDIAYRAIGDGDA